MKNINKKKSHPEVSLLRISRLRGRYCFINTNNPKNGGPELQLFRTTTLFNAKAFTLIELLVVVLIIGILAAVAIPQYEKAVEKARMTEAIINLRAIANANQVYYLANGVYAEQDEIDKLDVQIPGQIAGQLSKNRIATKDFIYSPNGDVESYLALAWRAKNGKITNKTSTYYLYVSRHLPTTIKCNSYAETPLIQKQLCAQIEANGTL